MLTIINKRHKKTAEIISGSYVGTGGNTTLPLGFIPTLLMIHDDNGNVWKWGWGMGWNAHKTDASGNVSVSLSIFQYLGKELDDNPDQTGDDYAEPYIPGEDKAGVVITEDNGGPNTKDAAYRFWAFG